MLFSWVSFQYLPDLARQTVQVERLLQKVNIVIQHPSMGNNTIRITGYIQNFEMRVFSNHFPIQLIAVHVRHDHIGEQQMNWPVMLGGNGQYLVAIFGFE